MERICDEIEKWLASLPSGDTKGLINLPVTRPRVHPVTFTFHQQPVSFMSENGQTFFNATQMARCFGKNPGEWLRLAGTVRFLQSLAGQSKSESMESLIITVRGSRGVTWIEYRPGLELARWLSPEFFLWCNDCLRELISRGYVVLKEDDSDTRSGAFPVPTTNTAASCDDFIENRDFFKSSLIAEELRITTFALHRFLVEEKICRYERRQYAVYPAYNALQCDFPYRWTNKCGKTYVYSISKRWTKAGRKYILELYRKKNPMPCSADS
jgi:hypothetical protein